MTIYTVMGSTDRTEWIAKSFTCERTATEFLHFCKYHSQQARSASELQAYSPDPGLIKPHVLHNLHGGKIYYNMESNELVTDAFMELTLQQSQPRTKFNKEFL